MIDTLTAFALHSFVHFVTRQFLPASITSKLSPGQTLYLCQKPAAIINALFVSLPTISQFAFKTPFDDDPLKDFPASFEQAFDRHLGFTLYDLAIMIVHKEHFSIYIHHIFGIIGIILIKTLRRAIVYPSLFLPSELTVIVSSAIWIVQTLKYKTGSLKLLFALRFVLFMLLRMTPGIACLLYPAIRLSKTKGISFKEAFLKILKEFSGLKTAVKIGVIVNVSTFTALNTWWTYLTYKALIKASQLDLHHI